MKSLSSRLTIWYALVVTLTVAALLLVGRSYLEHNMNRSIDLLNKVEFEEIRSRIVGPGTNPEEDILKAVREHAELDAALYFFQIGYEDRQTIFKSKNLGPYQLPEAVYGQSNVTVYDEELGWLRSSAFKYAGLDIHIASSLQSAEKLFDDYEQTGVIVCIGIFLLSLVFGFLLSRLAIHPIASIQATARRITVSRFNERIPVPNTNDEIARMAEFLNEMLDRLEASYEQVKRFTAEASHELRTPLSIIRLQAERLSREGALSDEERLEASAEQLLEIERLNKLIDDMLLLAKAEAGVIHLNCKPVDIAEFAADFQSDAELLGEDRGVLFTLTNEIKRIVHFDPVWMRHVLLNLLSNALNHSKPGDALALELKEDGGCPVFRMIDSGPGLPADKLDTVFERFERIDPENQNGGNGLGLAICRSIVQRHGGQIRAMNRTGATGLILEVRLQENARCCQNR